MNLLSFDLGGSSGKLYLTRRENSVCETRLIHRFPHSAHRIHEELYWDIFQIVGEMNTGIQKAVRETGDGIDSFGVDTFSNDFALLSETGELLAPVRCYRDGRTEACQEKIYERMSPQALHFITGNQNALFNTLMQLASMRMNGNGFFFENSARLLFLPDYLVWLLTGRAFCEFTVSSVSQMMDYRTGRWSEDILRAFGIPRTLLETPAMPGRIAGTTTAAFNRQNGTRGFPVALVCGHDTASAFLTSRCIPERHWTISCGTWALVGIPVEKPVVTEETFRGNFANEGNFDGTYRLSHNVMGLWLLQEIRRGMEKSGETCPPEELSRLAMAAEPFRFIVDVDDPRFFHPEDMLHEIRDACLRRYGQAPRSIGEVVRCIYESLAVKFEIYIREMERILGIHCETIHMVGGGAAVELLCQFTADICQKRVLAGPEEATAIGNAAAQLYALGAVSSIEEALSCFAPGMKEYVPDGRFQRRPGEEDFYHKPLRC